MTNSKRQFILFLILVLGIVVVAILAPVLVTHDPQQAILTEATQAPSSEHWFGTDRMGRDLFSRVIYGTRTSLSSTLLLVISIFTVGGVLGIVAGYAGGAVDAVIMRISDMMVSFPGMALAIAMAGIMGPSITNAVIAITMVSWTKYARLARSLVLKTKYEDYVLAAKISGTRTRYILWRYMTPSVLPTLIITAATDMGGMMLELAAFSFLGLGAQSTSIEWGYMLNEGRAYMESAPWLMIYPGLAIFITVVSFNLLGDSLRDILDPQDSSKKQYFSKQKKERKKHEKLALKREKLSMKKWIKGAGLLLITLMITASFAGCGNDSTKDDAGTTNDSQADTTHLNFGVYNYSDSLDPATNTNSSWAAMRFGITESLFIFNDQVVAENNLCDSYEVSDDYLTWTLHIRDGVKFSNGNDMTPSAVKASIERLYAETDASQGGTGNSNPESYLTYKSISADDAAGTVTIVCESPTSNIPGILAYPYFAIIDASVADKEIVGTGPYKVDKFNPGVNIDMSSNERYWNGKVPYKTVNIMFIDDSSTKTMALKSGDIDLTENITTVSDLATLSEDSAYYVSTAAGVRTANSYMNFKGVLENEALRQAIIIALDIDTMCDITVGGMYTPGFSVLPSSLAYNYDKLNNPFSFNKENAIKILDDAGIVDSNGDGWRELDGQNIDLDSVTFTSRNLNEFAEASALLLKEIGIKVTVNIRDYDTALALLNAGEFDLWTCNTLTVGVGDPQDYLSNWYSKNSRNFGYYSSSEYDAAFEELMIEMDDNRRLELITELQQILIDGAATIVYGYYNSRMFSDISKVTGADIATIDYYWLTTDIKPAR